MPAKKKSAPKKAVSTTKKAATKSKRVAKAKKIIAKDIKKEKGALNFLTRRFNGIKKELKEAVCK